MNARLFPLFALFALLLSACAPQAPAGAAETTSPASLPAGQSFAAPPNPSAQAAGNDSTHQATNPSSGASLYVSVAYPKAWDGQSKLPTLIFVPGGSGDSGGFLKQTPAGSTVSATTDAGMVAIVFDPDGRGQSGGTENYNGFIQQDGLAEVIRFASTLPGVDSANIGLVATSYGITMGAGALARHPGLPVKFLIDWEGPANRDDTGGCDGAGLGHLAEVAACDDETFWAEREASAFISQIRVPYQRIQSEKDHVQPDYDHTVLMINNAVNGSAPWVRLNDESPNQALDPNALPRMLPESADRQKDQLIVKYAQELFGAAASAAGSTAPVQVGGPASSSAGATLYFTIGMHIEPMGETAQGFRGGKADYHTSQFFEKHAQDILAVAQIVESHGGRMTVQAQSPFTSVAVESGNTILADLAARGHELALHFHEDAHLGKNGESLSVQQWCDVMKQEIALITQASGVTDIRYWSGGNLYADVYAAAACAGLDVNSDWKNPELQETPLEFVGVHPWRPAGGTDGVNLLDFIQHDPNGPVVFLPEGQYDKTNFASMRRTDTAGGDEAYFEYLKESFYASLAAAEAGKVNVFHFTIHPGEFRGDANDPFGVIERFLAGVVDPLVASGQVQWATFSQMADAFAAWEAANPGVEPR